MEFDYQKLGREYMLGIQRYGYNRSKYLSSYQLLVDDETRRQIIDNYKKCIFDVINYLRKIFPNGFLKREGTITVDYEEMINNIGVDAMSFIEVPKMSGTIYPVIGSDARLTFEDNVLVSAAKLETIPNLPKKYKSKAFNDVLNGHSIYEIRDLLDNLGVLPVYNNIDVMISEYGMRLEESVEFINNVIIKLLLNGTEEDFIRAYFFDRLMSANFDFDEYKTNKRTKK